MAFSKSSHTPKKLPIRKHKYNGLQPHASSSALGDQRDVIRVLLIKVKTRDRGESVVGRDLLAVPCWNLCQGSRQELEFTRILNPPDGGYARQRQ
jgi:hypothetical protein